ncbi:MAG: hypothetical protein M3389_16675 [Actinomycetota bacterium]|nr:hypothetical protein [Actinomycetota bacterium]
MTAASRTLAAAAAVLALAAPPALADPGDLDTSFGEGGTVLLSPADGGRLTALALSGEKIVATGVVRTTEASCAGRDIALLRLLGNGSGDPSFGTDGLAVLSTFPCDEHNERQHAPLALALAPGGEPFTAGWAAAPHDFNGGGLVTAHTANGAFDTSFDGDGFVRDEKIKQGGFHGLVRMADGRLVAVGHQLRLTRSWEARRYLASGAPDPSFAGDGSASYGSATGERPNDLVSAAIADTADGAVVAVGESSGAATIGRILPDGALDPGFGDGGRKLLTFAGEATAGADVVKTADGGYVIAGSASPASGATSSRSMLLKVDAAGELDPTFGAGGRVDGPVGDAIAVAVDAEDRIVLVGHGAGGAFVARYLVNGAPDGEFGEGGLVALGAQESPSDVAVQPDGRIVVAGSRDGSEGSAMSVIRLLGDDAGTGTGSTDGEIGNPGNPNPPGGPGTPPVTGGLVPNRQGTGTGGVSIRIVSSRVTARGVLVRITWPRGTDGTARARLWTRNKGILLGQRTVRAPAGTTGRTFRVPLNARAKRLLRGGKRLKVRATARVTGLPVR